MNNQIYDPIRKCYVRAFPEEIVRQNLIAKMINDLNFPQNLIGVEKDLSQVFHLKNYDFTSQKRRADIICFAKNIHPKYAVYPLLMIECKAHKLTKEVIEQVVGYNHFVKAYFVAVVNQSEIKTLWYNDKKEIYDSIDFLPPYEQLMNSIKKYE